MKNAKEYFDNHKQVERLYFTSDNLAFFDEQNAMNHAKQLKDKKVNALTRDEVYEELEDLSEANWDKEMRELLDEMEE
jgi:hypothetical protein